MTRFQSYVWLMQRDLNTLYPQSKIELIQTGISGQTSVDLQQRFQQDVLDKKPDLVTINVEFNDVIQSFNAAANESEKTANIEKYRQKLTAMVKVVQARNIPAILLFPTIITEDLNSR